MAGVSGINPVSSGYLTGANVSAIGTASSDIVSAAGASGAANTQASGLVAPSGSIMAMSSTSISASTESMTAMNIPTLATNEAIGAALLMLILQYMQSSDPTEKQGLLNVIASLAGGQQQQASGGSMLSYNSSQLNIESTQLVMINGGDALSTYAGSAATAQQAPQVDSGAAGLDVTA